MIRYDRFLYYYILTVISPHQPFQNRTIPQKSPTLLAPLPKVSFCCSAKHCQLLRDRCTNPRHTLTFPKPHYTLLRTNTLASLIKGELLLLSKAQPTIEGSSHQHRQKHFPHRQVVNIFVSISVQLH